jgi:hypothetical protein
MMETSFEYKSIERALRALDKIQGIVALHNKFLGEDTTSTRLLIGRNSYKIVITKKQYGNT